MHDNDIAEVTSLLDAAARADGRRPLSDHLYLDLVSGGDDGFAGLVAWEPGHEHPVAYAQVSTGNNSHVFELVIHPHHRYEMATIGPELMDAALDVVRSEGGGLVNWTIETRAFIPGADDEVWLSVNNRAFADHAEQGGWTLETFRTRQQEAWFDPKGFRILELDGSVAGFCWTKVHHDGHELADPNHQGDLGEIYVIAVDPDFHGHGLGSEMTLAGLDHLTSSGIATALLYVDAANEGAVAMYRRLGFELHSTNAAFVTEVENRPGQIPDRLGAC